MRKMLERASALMLALALIFGITAVFSNAAPYIDVSREVSLCIEHIENGTPVEGESFSLYKVAAVDKYGKLTAVSPFDAFPVDLNVKTLEEWKGNAGALEGYALLYSLEPVAVAVTDSEGKARFYPSSPLLPGLYLVGGTVHEQGKYKYISDPFCVILPSEGEDPSAFEYDVTARPKFSTKIEKDDSTVTRKVHKKWVDSDPSQRPESIVVYLLRDGSVYDTRTLNKANSWSYTWTDLDSSYRWTVAEKIPDNYSVQISLEGITFLIVNTSETPPPPPPPPEETTTTPEESTTTPEESTTTPEESTTTPEESTTTPDESTTTPDESTTEPSESFPVTTPGDEPTTKPHLPNTGQLWWPVPSLVAGGLGCFVLGALVRRRYDDE